MGKHRLTEDALAREAQSKGKHLLPGLDPETTLVQDMEQSHKACDNEGEQKESIDQEIELFIIKRKRGYRDKGCDKAMLFSTNLL